MQVIVNRHFLACDIQLWNERHAQRQFDLGLDDGYLARLPEPPAWSEQPLTAVVLLAKLPPRYGKSGFERTVEEYWRRLAWSCITRGGRLARMPDLRFDPEHLVDLGAGAWEPGYSWVVLDLAAGRYTGGAHSPYYASLIDLAARPSLGLAGLEVLAAAATHLDWVLAMDGDKVPYVWLPGLGLRIDGNDHRVLPYTPALSYVHDDGDAAAPAVLLSASPSHLSDPSFAVPRVLARVNPSPDVASGI